MPRQSKAASAPFRAWDTEGVGAGRRHRTVCLVTDQGAVVADPAGCSSRRLLGALWRRLRAERDYLHISFAFGYDVAMMLRDLPRATLATLWAEGAIRWGPYRLTYRPRRSFAIYRRTPDGRTVGGQVWDVFGFFQCSLLAALDRHGIGDAPTRALLARMKARRGTFRARELPALIEYSRLENVALVALMNDVRQSALDAGLPLARWDGAGAAASALLIREGAAAPGVLPPRPVPVTADPWPQAVRTGARFAYFGGRIEVGQVGHHAGPVVRYDVRSAYPAVLATLPAGDGRWVDRGPGVRARGPWALYQVAWNLTPGWRWYPFPWRARDGAVTFPAAGSGWYWAPEVEAYFATWPDHALRVLACWEYIPRTTARPWRWVREVYRLRAEWKRAGVGAEKVLKLGLNSLYGKLAQTLGGDAWQAPRWHALEWAGYITSATRARLYRAAVAAGDAAVGIATDALFTTRSLTARQLAAPVGPGLGEWERTDYTSGTWVQSGVYWVGAGAAEASYHRGFSPAVLHRADVLAAWRRGARSLTVPETRFQGVGASVGSATAYARRATWVTADRTLALVPYAGQKRYTAVAPRTLARGLVWTWPRQPVAAESWDGVGGSAPVALPWAPDGIAPPDTRASDETAED